MKIYGNTKTNLELSEKAFHAYSNTDPLKIAENEDGTYTVTGAIEMTDASAADVNAALEDLYEDCFAEDYSAAYWTLESWGADYPPEDAAEVVDAANAMIDAYAIGRDADEVADYSSRLWGHYCEAGRLD